METSRESPVPDDIPDEVPQGEEPGASAEHYLGHTDSYEDLEDAVYNGDIYHRKKSGTISSIKKETRRREKAQEKRKDAMHGLRSSDAYASSDDGAAGSSTSATLSENESDYTASQEMLASTPTSSTIDKHVADINDTIQQLKLVRSESVASEHDAELEFVHSKEWRDKKKHIFVFSQSGKPVYCRYGNEEKIVTIFGVMQALVSFIADDNKDVLRCINAGQRKFVFLIKEHLVMVAVTSLEDSIRHIQLQLSYVYNQILSVITLSHLNKIFTHRVNYDLRRMLSGTEKFIDSIITTMDTDTSYLLGSVRCLPLLSNVRDTISSTLVQHCKVKFFPDSLSRSLSVFVRITGLIKKCKTIDKDLVFAIIISDNQLVTVVRMKRFVLDPQDLHIILNLVNASDAFKAAESWLPICLPKFDSGGLMYAYISYLDEPCNACLLLLTVDNGAFSVLSECKKKVVERLNRYSCLQAIAESVSTKGYNTQQVGIPELRHFIYKSRSTLQFTSPQICAPYVTPTQKERLHGLYLNIHGRMHSSARPIRIMYKVTQYESILGWVTNGFELYAVFSPLITKHSAISSVNKLLKWMKREESRLFLLSPTTF